VTYTASNLRGGIDGDAVESALATARAEPAADADRFEVRLLRSYGRWIEYNARVTAVNDMFATITVLMVIAAFVYVVAGIGVGALGPDARLGGRLPRAHGRVAVARSLRVLHGPPRCERRALGGDVRRRPDLEGRDPKARTVDAAVDAQ